MSRSLDVARQVLEIEAKAIEGLLDQIDESFERAVSLVRESEGRVVCTGMGKSGHVMKKVAATLASTGTPALFLHPAEAIHGDLGMIMGGDILLAASFGGATQELLQIVRSLKARPAGPIAVISMTGSPDSPLAKISDLHLSAGINQEACPLNLAPTASTTATLALGDALAMALLEERGFTDQDFAHLHPGGLLGRRLKRVEEVMHSDRELPRVASSATMRDAVVEMSSRGKGITGIVDEEGRLVGAFSDGDLRRLIDRQQSSDFLKRPVSDFMSAEPKSIQPGERLHTALEAMESYRITSIFVCDDAGKLVGLVHVHDLWDLRAQ